MPKLSFHRSWLYEQALAKPEGYNMPSDKILDTHVKKMQREWLKHGDIILKEIAHASKLKWHEKEIICYVTAGVIPYSDPLTINLLSDIHTITHELIHRIISEPENWRHIQIGWAKLMKKYKSESPQTRTHIVIHAIHGIILRKLFGEKVLEKEKQTIKRSDYIRAWELADQEGYENIVKQLLA